MRAARAALREIAVAQQDRFCGACVRSHPAQEHVAEQRRRLDVAAIPAHVLGRDRGDAVFDGGGRDNRQRLHVREDRRASDRLRHVIAFGFDAARDLDVQQQIAAAIAVHQRAEGGEPARAVERGRHADFFQAAIEPVEMLVQAVRPAAVDRQHFVDAVAEQEAAVERRDPRLRERQQAAIEPDERQRQRWTLSRTRTGSCPRSCGRCCRAARPRAGGAAPRR